MYPRDEGNASKEVGNGGKDQSWWLKCETRAELNVAKLYNGPVNMKHSQDQLPSLDDIHNRSQQRPDA